MASPDHIPPSNGVITQEIPRSPDESEESPQKDLQGCIIRESSSIYPKHGGGFSDVHVGYYTDSDGNTIKVAIKVLRVNDEPIYIKGVQRRLNRETRVWHQLKHPNILEFLGIASDHGRLGCPALISPYCDNDTVPNYIRAHPETDRMFMIKGIAAGLEYLHQKGVIHGDLKPSNALVDAIGNPLLCDFGRSKIINQRGFTTVPAGACRYQAVELLNPEENGGTVAGPTKPADVYALGISCYEIWTGLQPYHHMNNDPAIAISVVMKNIRPEYPNPARPGTEHLWPIFEACWDRQAINRPNVEGVVRSLGALN